LTTCSSCLEESDRVVWGTGNYLICKQMYGQTSIRTM
jgi:hypothetical protein